MSKTFQNCQECSACCSDGKDEKIKECVSQGIKNKECSPRLDKTCATGTTTTAATTTITDATKGSGGLAMEYVIIIVVFIFVALVVLFIGMVYMYLKQKRKTRPSVGGQRNGSANAGKLALYTCNIPVLMQTHEVLYVYNYQQSWIGPATSTLTTCTTHVPGKI